MDVTGGRAVHGGWSLEMGTGLAQSTLLGRLFVPSRCEEATLEQGSISTSMINQRSINGSTTPDTIQILSRSYLDFDSQDSCTEYSVNDCATLLGPRVGQSIEATFS